MHLEQVRVRFSVVLCVLMGCALPVACADNVGNDDDRDAGGGAGQTDSDADGDGDSDNDSDSDSDGDTDSDTDPTSSDDSDSGEAGTDTDSETDSGTHADADADTDTDNDTDTDTDTDSDTDIQQVQYLMGVSLAGADFGEGNLPGTQGVEYTYSQPSISYFIGKGMNAFRIPFRWERLQRGLYGELHEDDLTPLTAMVNEVLNGGSWAILDPHNYARYHGDLIGSAEVPLTAFADFWTRLARHFTHQRIIYAIMNEPHTMSTEQWLEGANAAIEAIRDTGAKNLILVPGNAWTGAHSWLDDWYGTSNSTVMLGVVDPIDNYAYEVHQYLNTDSSGTAPDCVSATIGSERLAAFTAWARANGKRGFLGEFAGGPNQTCYDAVDDMVTFVGDNTDAWLGWTWWAAGPWWGSTWTSIEPDGDNDKLQMDVLEPHLI